MITAVSSNGTLSEKFHKQIRAPILFFLILHHGKWAHKTRDALKQGKKNPWLHTLEKHFQRAGLLEISGYIILDIVSSQGMPPHFLWRLYVPQCMSTSGSIRIPSHSSKLTCNQNTQLCPKDHLWTAIYECFLKSFSSFCKTQSLKWPFLEKARNLLTTFLPRR